MSCNKFKKYQLGLMAEGDFLNHKKGCAFCQEQERLDAQLMTRIKSEQKTIKAPLLWDRIEASLKEEQKLSQKTEKRSALLRMPRLSKPAFAAAAAMVLTAGLVLFFWLSTGEKSSEKLLDQAALNRVEQKESEYMKAITTLEQRVKPKLGSLDLELMLLYKDKLQTIDDQIELCQEELVKNPGNTHIRYYLLAALQDKKDTLSEIMGVKNRIENGT